MSVRLYTIGDSITENTNVLYTASWPKRLLLKHVGQPFGVKNVALSGDTTVLQRTKFDNLVSGRGATHVAFLIGTNDLTNFPGDSAATIFARIAAMATIAEAQGARALLLSILPRGEDLTWTGAMEQRRTALNTLLAGRSGSLFIDTSAAMTAQTAATGTAWAPSTAYSVGDRRVNGGRLYIVLTAGTSAGSGGPSGTGTVVDGTVTWVELPRLIASSNGALHPDDAGQQVLANTVDAAAIAAGTW